MNLVLKGKAGQGVQLMSFVLANALKDSDYHVSIVSNYSPLARAGTSAANLVISKEEIENPIFEDDYVEYDLSGEEFKEVKIVNMFLVGKILKSLNVELNNIQEYLPEKRKEENLEEIKNGYGQ
jgi:Pyruvate/2-oxoacid:ferredoxin oxidoreductase gamma subunit